MEYRCGNFSLKKYLSNSDQRQELPFALKIDDGKAISRLLESMKLIFTIVYERLKIICLMLRDWFEDRESYYQTVDTHNYSTKILLINKLRNQ